MTSEQDREYLDLVDRERLEVKRRAAIAYLGPRWVCALPIRCARKFNLPEDSKLWNELKK